MAYSVHTIWFTPGASVDMTVEVDFRWLSSESMVNQSIRLLKDCRPVKLAGKPVSLWPMQ